mgnify:CR=1 FL=1|jgi:hypothetical protein
MRLLPDYRVFRVTVCATQIYEKLHVPTPYISWQIFQTKIWNLQFLKYFWLRLEIRAASITYFSYSK